MWKNLVAVFACVLLMQSIAFCASDGFPLRGSEAMRMTPPAAGRHGHESKLRVIFYRAGGAQRPSERFRYEPEVGMRGYYDCSYYKYCDCSDIRFSNCWQCKNWVYYWDITD